MRNELLELRREHEKLLAAYGRLKWALDGVSEYLRTVFNLSPLNSRIVAALLAGRSLTAEQLMVAAWETDPDSGVRTVATIISQMKKNFPWFKTFRTGPGRNKVALYQMTPESIAYVKAQLAEAG